MFSETVGIDLGTSYTRIYMRGAGIVLCEPTVAAIDNTAGKILSVGLGADEMIGREPKNVHAIRPLKHGVISDYQVAQQIIKYFVRKALGNRIFKPSALICVPGDISEVCERAVIDAAIGAGLKNVELCDVPIASAMGAGLDILKPRGAMVVDIGAGSCDVAVLSMGGMVLNSSVKTAGESFDKAIKEYIKKEKRIAIGEKAAEEVKIKLASLNECGEHLVIKGRCLLTGLPKTAEITSGEILPAIENTAMDIVSAILTVLENTPPQLLSDISESGIVLCGGGASMEGIETLILRHTGIECSKAERSDECTALGIGKMIDGEKLNKAL